MSKSYNLADYRRQANKPPFPFKIDDDRTIMIEPPDGDAVMAVMATDNVREQFRLLAGESFDEIIEIVGAEQGGVLKALLQDMSAHFGLS